MPCNAKARSSQIRSHARTVPAYPVGVKAGLRTVYQRLADALEFDHLLLAHGEPWIGGAREALRRFAAGEEP